jgi:hypothetical protein
MLFRLFVFNQHYSMNHKSLLLSLALVLVQFSGSPLLGQIEFAPAPPSISSPAAAFAFTKDGELQLTVSLSDSEIDLTQLAVSVETADGGSLQSKTTATPGVYLIRPKTEGILRVRMEPSEKIEEKIAPGEADVYFGDFDQGLRELEKRRAALKPVSQDRGLNEAQNQDQRLWLEHWLKERCTESHPSKETPVDGKLASAFRFAWEMVSLAEQGNDSLQGVRGRQLPARRSFLARDANSEQSVAFDYILRIPDGALKESYPLLVIVHGFTPDPNIIGGLRAS